MSKKHVMSVGDTVILDKQSHGDNPPVGTIGVIADIYEAIGGTAARVDWDVEYRSDKMWEERVLLKHLSIQEPPEINESDTGLDVLFGGVTV